MKIGERAGNGMRAKICAEPFLLARADFATADFGALAIENDDVPGAEIVAVIAVVWITGSCAEILEVIRCPLLMEFVIAGRWTSAAFHAAPRLVVAHEIFFAAVGISEITCGKNGAGDLFEELRCGFRAGEVLAIGNVTGTDEDGGCVRSWGLGAQHHGAQKYPCAKSSGQGKCKQKSRAQFQVNPSFLRVGHNYLWYLAETRGRSFVFEGWVPAEAGGDRRA